MLIISNCKARNTLAILAGAVALMTASASWAAETIKLGTTGPLSGSLSLLGQGVRDGIETYIKFVNDQGGVNGLQIELISEDDGYDPMRAVASAKKLIEQNRVIGLISPVGTPSNAAMVPYVQEKKVPLFAPYAFSHTLTTPIKRYVFTTLPEVRIQASVLADYLTNTLKHTKIAVIYQNDDFGQDAVIGFEDRLKKSSVPVTKLPFDRGATNFSGVVAQARQSGAEDVVFFGIPRDAALIMKEANKMGWKPQFSGHNALGDPQTFTLAGTNLVEGAIAVAVMEPLESAKPEVAQFLERQKKYMPKTTPTTYSMHGYNATQIFVEAMKRIQGTPTSEKIVAELEKINGLNTGLMAPVTFTPNQRAGSLAAAFMRAKGGKWVIDTPWMEAK